MAYEFLNETTFTKDLAQQEELLHQIQDRMLPRTEPAEYDDTPLDTDIIEILEQESTEEEPEKEPVDQNDSFDFEQEDMTNDDMEILGFLFQKPSRTEGAGTMTYANGAVSHINSEPMSLGWVKTKSPKVNISNVGSPISKYLESLPQNLRDKMVATSGNDQKHAKGSRHYQNKAIDLRYDKELYDYINSDPNRQKYGLRLLDPDHGTAPHIHLDYQYGGEYKSEPKKMQLGGVNDKAISEDPVQFLKSYYNSSKFGERARRFPSFGNSSLIFPQQFAENLDGAKPYVLPEGYSKGKPVIGSTSFYLNNNFLPEEHRKLNIPKGTNMLLDPDEVKNIGLPRNYLFDEVYPHELTHFSARELDPSEEYAFIQRNKLQDGKALKLYDKDAINNFYVENKDNPEYNRYSNYVKSKFNEHDLAPDENYSDLNSLRYMLLKQGIYDTRNKDFDKDFLEKAKKDKLIKDSYIFNRLRNSFSDEDLIWLMNNIAQNSKEPSKLDTAKYGSTLVADDKTTLQKGLNDPRFNSAVLKLVGKNKIRGLDNNQPVAVTDGTKYKILRGPNDTEVFQGNVYETKI